MGKVDDILAQRRKENMDKLERRRQEVYQAFPEIYEIDKEVKRLNIARIQKVLVGEDTDSITRSIDSKLRRRTDILNGSDFPNDYLEMTYFCDICKDTGVYNMRSCTCRKQLVLNEKYNQSKISERIKLENFERFNFNLFRKDRMENENLSPYENIKVLYKNAREYTSSFNTRSPNLYLYGDVGTGKTYMINSMAKEIMDKGFSVLYQSANELVDIIASYQFAYASEKINQKKRVDFIYDVDLLIIDDLGTEIISDVSKSILFELINQRIVNRKPTIISSNIGPYDLADIYDPRIFSRINGQYIPMYFFGNDVRLRG